MTSTNDDDEGAVDCEQLETAKMLLESAHGMALKDGRAGEAYGFNEGIDVIEDAMEGKFIPDAEPHDTMTEYVHRSREAREEGYSEATLMDQRFGTDSRDISDTGSLLVKFKNWVMTRV